MKKTFLLSLLTMALTIPTIMPACAHDQAPQENKSVMYKHPSKEQMRKQFEQRLNLTVKLSRISEKAQKERIAQINTEIKELEKQAQEIRKKNSQEFESILNKKQKAELEKMKAEGRERFERYHKARPPFQGLGTPNILLRPVLPPPPALEK